MRDEKVRDALKNQPLTPTLRPTPSIPQSQQNPRVCSWQIHRLGQSVTRASLSSANRPHPPAAFPGPTCGRCQSKRNVPCCSRDRPTSSAHANKTRRPIRRQSCGSKFGNRDLLVRSQRQHRPDATPDHRNRTDVSVGWSWSLPIDAAKRCHRQTAPASHAHAQ